ncbi:MAG: hypothetical protein EOP86_11300 [Verrucomicrobiaceae bacterium]|nr:MAG: hypothetical protein EOP86_11300 [Verrucomicrobiaceae bacterium]
MGSDSQFRHKDSLKRIEGILSGRIRVEAEMQQKRGSYADFEEGTRLCMLAFLWDELADRHGCRMFRQEFQADLDHLRRFQSEFPEVSSAVLITLLERKVMHAFREKFSRKGIQALRARLNSSN